VKAGVAIKQKQYPMTNYYKLLLQEDGVFYFVVQYTDF